MAKEYLNNKDFESIILDFQYYKRHRARCELIVSDLEETGRRRKGVAADGWLVAAVEARRVANDSFKNCQSQLAFAFYVLSENIANYAKFKGIDVDDAIQEGVLICFEKIDRFNPNYKGKNGQKAKAFNYMTTCILNHYRQLYRSSRNYGELKRRYHLFLYERCGNMFTRNGKDWGRFKLAVD